MAQSIGSLKFANFLKEKRISIRRAAEGLHVSDPTVVDWRAGTKTPSPEHRGAIRTWTNGAVVEEDWRTEREREQAANAAKVRPFDAPEEAEGSR